MVLSILFLEMWSDKSRTKTDQNCRAYFQFLNLLLKLQHSKLLDYRKKKHEQETTKL